MPAPTAPDPGSDPVLAEAAAVVRAEWRAEEEMWVRAAARAWRHGRSLADVARDLAARGDEVAVTVAGTTFVGVVVAVGEDVLVLAPRDGALDVALSAPAVPVALRIVNRARAGGRRPVFTSWRSRLLLHEDDEEVELGPPLAPRSTRGRMSVGRDHIVLCDRDGGESVVALAGVAWIRRAP